LEKILDVATEYTGQQRYFDPYRKNVIKPLNIFVGV
jgi:hypothetical protein